MKNKFFSSYTDKNDGVKIKTKVTTQLADLTDDLGNKFVFIDVDYKESNGRVINESVSIPAKDVPKLIKLLKKSLRRKK